MNSVERVSYTTTQTPQEKASIVSEIPTNAFVSIDNVLPEEYKEKINKKIDVKTENISNISPILENNILIENKTEIIIENKNESVSISRSYLPTSDR